MRLRAFKCLVVCFILTCVQTALAEDLLYRCGNTYQDTPCKGVASKPMNEEPARKPAITFQTKPVTKKVVAAKEPATSSIDADCKKRSENAKMIAKLREIGVSLSDQLSITADAAQKDLVKDVYSRNGSSLQIQNTVERECLQQKQKTTLTSNWMTRAKRALGIDAAPTVMANNAKSQTSPIKKMVTKPAPTQAATAEPVIPTTPVIPAATMPTPAEVTMAPSAPANTPAAHVELSPPANVPQSAPVVPPAAVTPAEPPHQVAQKEAPEDVQEDSQGICSALKAGVDNITSQRRNGGSASLMNDLKQQQIRLENTMKSAGC